MSKILKQYADQVHGIEIFPIISLIIFIVFFIGVLWYTKGMSEHSVEEMKNMPLDLTEENKTSHV